MASSFISRQRFVLNARGRCLDLGIRTALMGVVNLTPDSFSGDGRLAKRSAVPAANAAYALKLVKQGADIIDIGGESTRPGAQRVSVSDEIRRVVPTVRLLRQKSSVLISVDTYKPGVALEALDAGADIINSVQGTRLTKELLRIVKDRDAAIVLMHSRGTPRTMQRMTQYKDVVTEVIRELESSAEKCLSAGIKSDKIIVDPGIGFAKTVDQNLEILKRLGNFRKLGFPILIGTSRKSFIGKILNADASGRLWGTAATVALSLANGAHMVRVHDVEAMRQTVQVADAILNASS